MWAAAAAAPMVTGRIDAPAGQSASNCLAGRSRNGRRAACCADCRGAAPVHRGWSKTPWPGGADRHGFHGFPRPFRIHLGGPGTREHDAVGAGHGRSGSVASPEDLNRPSRGGWRTATAGVQSGSSGWLAAAIRTHLRITDGSASSASAPTGRWKPSASMRGTRAANSWMVSSKWVKPWRTSPAGRQRDVHRRERQRLLGVPRRRRASRCRAVRSCRRAAPPAGGGAAARCRRRRSARNARRGAADARASAPGAAGRARCRRGGRRSPPSTGTARRPALPACRPWRPGRTAPGRSPTAARAPPGWSPSCAASARSARLGRRQCLGHREQPRHDPLDVAVHRHRRQAERDRADGGGGVVADAGQRAQPGQVAREAAGRHHRLGAGVQVAGAGVVAKSCPGRQHRLQRRGGQRWRRWGSGLRIVHSRASSP